MSIFNNSNQQGGIQFGGQTLGYGTGVDDNGYRNILGQLAKVLMERGIDLASVPVEYLPQLAAAYRQAIVEATPAGQRAAFQNYAQQNLAQGAATGQRAARGATMRGLGVSGQQGAYQNMLQNAAKMNNNAAFNVMGPGSGARNAQMLGSAMSGALNNPMLQMSQQYQRARLGLPYQSKGGMTLGSAIGGIASLGGLGGGGFNLGNILKFITPINGYSGRHEQDIAPGDSGF